MKKSKFLKRTNPLYLNGICHRGLHDDVSSENSIGAFKKAIEAGYAFECDVHLTKDNKIVVIHDSNLERMTGRKGIVEELTLKEIKDNYSLKDGSKIPTLEEVLELNHEQVPMAIELKVVNKNYKQLAKCFVQVLKPHIKNRKNYILISFDPRSFWKCKKLKLVNSLIVGYQVPKTIKLRYLCDSLDLEFKMAREEIAIKYHKNHFINVWTIETEKDFNETKDFVDTVTFQHLNPEYITKGLKK